MSLRAIGEGLAALASRLIQSPLERERSFYRRFRDLSAQIDEKPEELVAYVLRGELNLEREDYPRAKTDFEAAVKLAERADDTKSWVVMEQVMRDRALYGLKLVERGL